MCATWLFMIINTWLFACLFHTIKVSFVPHDKYFPLLPFITTMCLYFQGHPRVFALELLFIIIIIIIIHFSHDAQLDCWVFYLLPCFCLAYRISLLFRPFHVCTYHHFHLHFCSLVIDGMLQLCNTHYTFVFIQLIFIQYLHTIDLKQ